MTHLSVIGCGESGALWDGTGPSLGVNDCEKFGKPVDFLLLLNHRHKFADHRLQYIEGARPKMAYSHIAKWGQVFTNFTQIETRIWPGLEIKPNVIYHSKTSPFCAISLGHVMGFKEIVLYGVDFKSHHSYSPGRPHFEQEKIRYETFVQWLEEAGTKVYTIKKGNLNLPVWTYSKVSA